MTAAVHAITPMQSDSYYVEQFTIMVAYILGALVIGSTTLRRRTK